MFQHDNSMSNFKNGFLSDDKVANEAHVESFNALRKEFLLENARKDGRKKLCNEMSILSESILDSAVEREMLELEEDFHSH